MITDYMCRGIIAKVLTTLPMSNGLNKLAFNIQSALPAGSDERLDFLGTIGPVREWVGKRQPQQPREFNFTIKNKKWEDTVRLPLEWLRSDKTGNVQMVVSQLGGRMIQWKSKLLADLVNNGTTGGAYVGFDGLSFFNASHVYGDASVNNIVTFTTGAGPTLVTAYEFAKALVKAYQQIIAFNDDRGEPINEDITSLTVVVPAIAGSQMAAVAMMAISLAKLDTGSGSVDNPVLGIKGNGVSIDLIPSPRLTGNNAAVFNTSPNAVPFVFQENTGERNLTLKGAGSDYEHDQDAWEYGLRLVGNVGYGRFTDAVQIQFS
jgi:phage major head subunit gpT-like protein